MSQTVTAPNDTTHLDPGRWGTLAILAVVQAILTLDTTVVNVALPSIQHSLDFTASGLAWVVNGYTLMAGGFLLLGGRLADMFGRRRLFMIGLTVFAIASAVSGVAQGSTMLVLARFAQGLGEAIAAPAALSLVVLTFQDPKERAKAVGIWGGLAGLGGTLGVILAGLIVTYLDWRWIFLINVPIAVVVLLVVPHRVKESRIADLGRLDVLGALLATSGLVLLVDGLLAASTHAWGSPSVLLPIGAGVVLLCGFVVSQAIVRSPLVPLRFFRNRTRVTANLASVLMTSSFTAIFFIATLYMQQVLHYSALRTGFAYVPLGFALLIGVGLAPLTIRAGGVRIALVGAFLISAAGLAFLARIGVASGYTTQLLPGLMLFGLGAGIAFPSLQNAALHDVDDTDAGLASGVQTAFQQVGSSLGLSVLVTLALRHASASVGHGTSAAVASTNGYALAMGIAAGICLFAALAVGLTFERLPKAELQSAG